MFNGRRQTWTALNRSTEKAAGGLKALGVSKGNCVTILALNSERYVEAFFAIWRLTAAAVPLNTRWSEAEFVRDLDDCEPSALIVDDAFAAMLPRLVEGRRLQVIHMGDGETPAGAKSWLSLQEAEAVLMKEVAATPA